MAFQVPSYRLHKGSGQAIVQVNGIRKYLGKHGTEASQEAYRRAVAEWLAAPHQPMPNSQEPGPVAGLTVNDLILAYWEYAKTYYSKGGKPTKELTCMREALRPLRQLYGRSPAADFGPKALKAIQQHMVSGGLSRGVINHRTSRIKRVFKWAVSEEVVPASVHHGLQAVGGLRFGRTKARETEPIKPVPKEWVDRVVPYVSPPVAAMLQLQWLTGMRPCEVVAMRVCDIDMTGEIWIYRPHDHKNRWRGHERQIPLGPQAQQVLSPFLDRPTTAFLFSPREAEQWRHARRRQERQTPLTPSQTKRRAKAKPKRAKRDHYDTGSYRGAIEYGIRKANLGRDEAETTPHWFPLQIRHSRGTEIRRRYGLDAAQVSLGHARADVTQVYAEKNLELAVQIAKETG